MALFHEGALAGGAMEASNFAHVIFQNVGKSFLPNAALECRYTLTHHITPHHRDWVGIFKVGWNTARDYYTFQWAPFPENSAEGGAVTQAVVFQGYYLPKDDGEFYQFCYVTHRGEIRGASTPFHFCASTPAAEHLLTVEDESNSDILVVTSKTDVLEQKVEEAQREKEELTEAIRLLQEEKAELQLEQERLRREREQERETCTQLRSQNQELQHSSQMLQEEKEEAQRKQKEAEARVLQLEENLRGVTQKGLLKESELECLRDRMKKLSLERDCLESQLKMERDEREMCKIHLRNTELENTKLSAELQMLRSVDMNKEITIAQFQDELSRLRAERDRLQEESLAASSLPGENSRLKEQLRQAEEQLQVLRQQAAMLASELRDTSGARDHSVSELHRARLEADALRTSLAEAQAECGRVQQQLQSMRTTAPEPESKKSVAVQSETPLSESEESVAVSQDPKDTPPAPTAEEMLSQEKQCSAVLEEELAEMEQKWRAQCSLTESLTLQLAAEEERHKSQMAEKEQEVKMLEERVVEVLKEKEKLEEELQRGAEGPQDRMEQGSRSEGATPIFLHYPIPYPQCPAELQFGNPYSSHPARGGADSEFPPGPLGVGPPSQDSDVVCIQPTRNLNPPDGLEEPKGCSNQGGAAEAFSGSRTSFCFDSRSGSRRRCPLCELVFPPQFEQSRFEEHVDGHWRACPVCSQQFPLDCNQQAYERHVHMHFHGNTPDAPAEQPYRRPAGQFE
ncbi:tax1-binding protein 1 homolog A isoform X2 [Megalops cyprinoides]|uniref:tax1-binding protein 1 homolog A isoform X2 n=1 Tax=Megalops cyprinoides TaxID=118141 RepID=UPI0018640401|nr:tax1-binding protein 1 homolog A isoform X2 [Megalops cyprinoides]